MKVGLDIMGGDYAPESTVKGAILAKQENPKIEIVLLGDEEVVRATLMENGGSVDDFTLVHCSQEVTMHDHPTRFLAQKPDSGIAKGFKLLKTGEIDALASAGNTGAMWVGSLYTVNAIAGIIRPCITSILPKLDGGQGVILDVGANADCKADVLYQFGILGSIYAKEVYGIENPRVGLLNIGEEEEKGNLLSQAAHELMKGTNDFNFIGNIEGRDLFSDECDVVVCDGFTGNVVLKQAEAVYTIHKKRKIDDEYFNRFNYELYGGTPVLGVNGNVIIGHGISSPKAIKNMIFHAADVIAADLPGKIKKALNNE